MYIKLKENETMKDLVDRLAHSFELVNDIAPVAYWYEDLYPNGRIKCIHFSKHLREMLGYKSEEEFPDDLDSFVSFIHPDDVQRMLNAAIAAGTGKVDGYDIKYRIRKVDGSYLWARATGEIVVDSNGTTVGMYGGFIDVTPELLLEEQQKKLQEALDIANIETKRFEIVTSISETGKWNYGVSKDDKVISANYGEIIYSKVNAETVNPMQWIDIVHPEDRDRVLKGFMAAIYDHSGKTYYDETFRIVSKDGGYRWSRSIGKVLRLEDGTGDFYGYSMDMTRQIEEQQKRLLGAMPLSNVVLTKANIGMWAFELDEGQPPRMYDDETMLGLVGLDHAVPPEEAYHAWYDNIDKGSYDLVNDAVAKMIAGEHAEVQYPWHYPDGRTIIVRCGGVRNYNYKKGIRIEGTHQDVTQTLHFDEEQRKRDEQQKQAEIARIKAEASDKAKTEFLFNMSHDIRTPMNAILGYTDIAIRHTNDPIKVDESLQKIKVAGGHLLNLINDILEMSRIEAGVIRISNMPLDTKAAADAIDLMSQALAASKGVEYSTNFVNVRNRYVYADELHINQIIINLISNAVKYTPRGGRVDFTIEQTSDPVDEIANFKIVVKDTGIGMSKEFQKHLFENFARENDSDVAKQEGAGLGLSIVKRITDLMGGTIYTESEKGKGSTFIVVLPVKVMDEDAIKAFKNSQNDIQKFETHNFKGKRILLVEDNELNREIATEILEENGLIVDYAENGSLAVEQFKKKGPNYYDSILMDVQMPVMNGYEATRAIRALPHGDKIPIIAVSANAFAEDKAASILAGMNDHVSKPINKNELFSVLSKHI